MGKLIIDNRSKLINDIDCLTLIKSVMKGGRISNNDKQYCYLTSFKLKNYRIAVATDLNKNSDKFTIYDEK